jgi:ABC-type transport system substrate-binding protein
MKRTIVITIAMLAILAITIVPSVSAWCIPPNPAGENGKFELYGPHVSGIICKVYSTTTDEWNDMLLHQVDIEDWALDPAWIATFGAVGGPWTEQNYGGEAGYYLFDVNNNATMAATDAGPFLPNPTSDFFLREALAYAVNRSDIVSLDATATPIYTPVPAYMGGYINADIAPGQPGAQYTYGGYTGDTATAIAILDAHHFPIGGDGWRYWDRNSNGVHDAGEDMMLIIYSRAGLRGDYCDHYVAVLNTVLKINTDYHSHVPRGDVTTPLCAQENFNIYTGGWIYAGPEPDYLCDLYNGSNYYHPGSPENYAGINYPDLNTQLTGIKLATSLAVGQAAALQAQYYFALHAASIPLWSVSGVKCYQNVPVTDAAQGNWTHLVNHKGQGVNSWWSTLNMYQTGALYPNNYVHYGFSSTVTLQNIVYAQWYWDSEVLSRIYDSGATGNPLTLATWYPQLYESWTPGFWTDPQDGLQYTKVTITLRPDVYWQDGQPLTAADVIYTLTECSKDLIDPTRPGGPLPPPWWYPTVQYMNSIELLDAYNIEILLNVNSVWAVGWVIGNVVIPKHIWKPIIGQPNGKGGWTMAPSGAANAVQGVRPDPNIIGTGPFRWSSGVGDTVGSTVTLVANTPGSTINGITNQYGYYLYYPIWPEIVTPNNRVKFNLGVHDYNVSIISEITLYNLFQGYTGDYSGDLDVTVRLLVDGVLKNVTTSLNVPTWNYTSPFPEPNEGPDSVTLNNWEFDADDNTMEYYFEVPALNPSFHWITVQVQITSPPTIPGDSEVNPWLGAWINVTLPIYVSLVTDPAGSNIFSDLAGIGVPGYSASTPAYITSEVPTPDMKTDGRDLLAMSRAFGTFPGYLAWNSACDVNNHYKVDGRDLLAASRNFGWTAPTLPYTYPLPISAYTYPAPLTLDTYPPPISMS